MITKWWFYVAGGVVIGLFYAWLNDSGTIRTVLMSACSILAFLLTYFERRGIVFTAAMISAGVVITALGNYLISPSEGALPEVFFVFALAFITSLIGGGMAKVARSASGRGSENQKNDEQENQH